MSLKTSKINLPKIDKKFRFLISGGVVILTLFLLLIIFFATQSVIEVWGLMQALPDWIFYTFLALIIGVISFSAWLIFKIFRSSKKEETPPPEKIITEETLKANLDEAEESGLDTDNLRQEISLLKERKASGSIYVAFFGDVSTGKSSIVSALIPDAQIETHVKGGSTQNIKEYTWKSDSGDRLILTDLPGRNEATGQLDEMIYDEAIRAQFIVYVTDSDLSRTQHEDVTALLVFKKPLIIALNKIDRFDDKEKVALRERLTQYFTQHKVKVVFIQSGGMEEIVKVYPDGSETVFIRERHPEIQQLINALQYEIDSQFDILSNLRDSSVFVLVQQKLDTAKVEMRQQQAQDIVSSSTKKAIIGAMAAMSPGSDLVIQGVLGTLMIKKLCKLYDVPIRQLDIDNFLKFSQGQLRSTMPLVLAVAGNGLKAFPGIGTLAGGLVHAVAYGIIFDALGKAVTKTLQTRGQLQAAPAALTFKEMLTDNLESRSKTFVKLAFDAYQRKKKA